MLIKNRRNLSEAGIQSPNLSEGNNSAWESVGDKANDLTSPHNDAIKFEFGQGVGPWQYMIFSLI